MEAASPAAPAAESSVGTIQGQRVTRPLVGVIGTVVRRLGGGTEWLRMPVPY